MRSFLTDHTGVGHSTLYYILLVLVMMSAISVKLLS